MRNTPRLFNLKFMKRVQLYFSGIIIFVGLLVLSGCIRLWGGATYVKNKPGDYSEHSYVLDTGRIGDANSQANITT